MGTKTKGGNFGVAADGQKNALLEGKGKAFTVEQLPGRERTPGGRVADGVL